MSERIHRALEPVHGALRVLVQSPLMPAKKDLLLGWILPLAVVLALFAKFLVVPGDIFYGDVLPYAKPSLTAAVNAQLYLWDNGPTSPNTWLLVQLPLVLVGIVAGAPLATRFYMVLLGFLPAPAMYWSAKVLFRAWWPNSKKRTQEGALVAGLFYLLASTNFAIFNAPTTTWGPSYIFLPILFALFVRYLQSHKRRDLVILAGLSSLANSVPNWLLLLPILAGFYLLGSVSIHRERWKTKVGRTLALTVATIFVNAYVFLPAVAGFLGRLGGSYTFYAFGSFGGTQITFDEILGQSRSRLIDVFMLGHPTFNSFHEFPQDWTVVSAMLPVLAFGVLLWRREAPTLFLAGIALVGLFLAKGANPPFGYLYFLLAANSPPGLSGLVFDVVPFLTLAVMAYALLLGRLAMDCDRLAVWHISLTRIPRLMAFPWKATVSANSKRALKVFLIIMIVVLGSLLSGSSVDLAGVYSYYGPHKVPQAYLDVGRFLDSAPGDFKVMWVPTSWLGAGSAGAVGVNWTSPPFSDTGGGFPSSFSNRAAVPPVITPYLRFTDHIGRMLSLLKVKYVIVHNDTSASLTPILYDLYDQRDLQVVWRSGFITVFENQESVSTAWEGPLTYVEGDANIGDILAGGFDPLSSAWFFARDAPAYSTKALQMANSVILFNSTCRTSSITQFCPPTISNAPVAWIGTPTSMATGRLPELSSTSESVQFLDTFQGLAVIRSQSFLSLLGVPRVLPGTNVTLDFEYTLPPSVVREGFSGNFTPGFNVMIKAFSWGDPNANFASVFPMNQTLINKTSGYFSIVLPVPRDLSGPFTLISFFYDGSFRPLSPWYYLGTLHPSLIGIARPAPPFNEGIVVESNSTDVRLYAPREGLYDFFARGFGNLTLSSASYQLGLFNGTGSLSHLGSLTLSSGWNTFSLSSEQRGLLAYVLLKPSIWPAGLLNPISATATNPTAFAITGTGTGAVVLLTETYSRGWAASHRNETALPLFNGLVTGIAANGRPLGSLEVFFAPQALVYAGDAFSLTSLAALVLGRRFFQRNLGIRKLMKIRQIWTARWRTR